VIRRQPGALRSNVSRAWPVMAKDGLWTGSRASGASFLDPGASRWEVVAAIDGLPSDSVTVLDRKGDTLWVEPPRASRYGTAARSRAPCRMGHVSFDTTFVNPHITGIAVLGEQALARHAARHRVGPPSALLTTGDPERRARIDGHRRPRLERRGAVRAAGASVYRFRPDLGRWSRRRARRDAKPGGRQRSRAGPGDGTLPLASAGERHELGARRGRRGRGRGARGPRAQRGPFGAHLRGRRGHPVRVDGELLEPSSTPAGPITNDVLHLAIDGPRLYVTSNRRGFSRYDGASWRVWPPHFCGRGCDTDTTFVQSASTFTLQVGFRGRIWVGCWSSPPYANLFQPGGAISSFVDFGDSQSFDHQFVVERHLADRPGCVTPGCCPGARFERQASGSARIRRPRATSIRSASPCTTPRASTWGASTTRTRACSGMSGRFVHGLAVTKNNRLWIGYDGKGLDCLVLPPAGQPPSNFFHLGDTSNLGVRGVAAQGDSVWILTNAELRYYASSSAATTKARDHPDPWRPGRARLRAARHRRRRTCGPPPWEGCGPSIPAARRTPSPHGALRCPTTRCDRWRSIRERRAVDHDRVRPGAARSGVRGARGPPLPALHVRLYPNPATITALGLGLRLDRGGRHVSRRGLRPLGARAGDLPGGEGTGDLGTARIARDIRLKPGLYVEVRRARLQRPQAERCPRAQAVRPSAG